MTLVSDSVHGISVQHRAGLAGEARSTAVQHGPNSPQSKKRRGGCVEKRAASGVVPGLLTESTRVSQKHLSGLSWHLVWCVRARKARSERVWECVEAKEIPTG